MATNFTVRWADNILAGITPPTAAQQGAGFVCGPADPDTFNWLFGELTQCVIDLDAALDALGGTVGPNPNFTQGTIV